MNLHERGNLILNRGTNSTAVAGVTVLYTRGATTNSLVVTPAVIGTDSTVQPSSTGRNQDRERYYFIILADLVAAGFGPEPLNGDRITEVLAGVPKVFEVTPRRNEPDVQENTQHDRVRVRCIPKVLS